MNEIARREVVFSIPTCGEVARLSSPTPECVATRPSRNQAGLDSIGRTLRWEGSGRVLMDDSVALGLGFLTP